MRKIFDKRNKALLLELVRTDFKLRYQGSVLGYAWSLLRPLFMFAILYLVFAVIFKLGDSIPNYPIYLLLGIVLWNFFQEVTSQSLGSIVGRGDLISKISIPRWMIILSSSMSALINLGLNLLVVFIFALINGIDFLQTTVLLPLYIIEIYALAIGLGLLLSALFVKYRDVSYIWEVILQAGFYATPILYPLSFVTNHTAQQLLFLNPMAQALQGARHALVTPETVTIQDVWGSNLAMLLPLSIVALFLVVGIRYFRKEAPYFAENL
jgi:ABC-2 type transport system permease protein